MHHVAIIHKCDQPMTSQHSCLSICESSLNTCIAFIYLFIVVVCSRPLFLCMLHTTNLSLWPAIYYMISTHFVTRSLRHPGDELHIVSPVYTHFVTLCTSSPITPGSRGLLVLMCICDCSVYLYFCIIHYRPIVAQCLV